MLLKAFFLEKNFEKKFFERQKTGGKSRFFYNIFTINNLYESIFCNHLIISNKRNLRIVLQILAQICYRSLYCFPLFVPLHG